MLCLSHTAHLASGSEVTLYQVRLYGLAVISGGSFHLAPTRSARNGYLSHDAGHFLAIDLDTSSPELSFILGAP